MVDETTPINLVARPIPQDTYYIAHGKQRILFFKKIRLLILPIILILLVSYKFHVTRSRNALALLGPSLSLRLYTNNIRFDNFKYPDNYEQPWSKRRVQSINSMEFNTGIGYASVICLQEVLQNQLYDIIRGLNEEEGVRGDGGSFKNEWTYYGVGRTDGVSEGEFAPILYKSRDFFILENTTFWLSETPDVPSRGWDAALERIVTMVTFQSKINPLIKFNVFNTHFDHRGRLARKKSSQLIVDKMKNYNGYPSFLCGDFNTEPDDEPYKILTKSGFKDSRVTIDKKFSYGHKTTFTGFDLKNEPNSIIDYIWSPYFTESVSRERKHGEDKEMNNFYDLDHHLYYKVVLKQFGILSNYFNGFHYSDHRPVVATYEMTRSRLF